LTTIVSVSTFSFPFSSLIFLLNNYFLAVVAEAKNSQSQSFQELDKHPRFFKLTEPTKAHHEGLSKFVRGTLVYWRSQEYSSDKFEGLYKSWQSPYRDISIGISENSDPFWLFKD
jgi:hypothetical protein